MVCPVCNINLHVSLVAFVLEPYNTLEPLRTLCVMWNAMCYILIDICQRWRY